MQRFPWCFVAPVCFPAIIWFDWSYCCGRKMRDSQRLFLRSLMSKQFLSEKETKTLYQKACGVYGGEWFRFTRSKTNLRAWCDISSASAGLSLSFLNDLNLNFRWEPSGELWQFLGNCKQKFAASFHGDKAWDFWRWWIQELWFGKETEYLVARQFSSLWRSKNIVGANPGFFNGRWLIESATKLYVNIL